MMHSNFYNESDSFFIKRILQCQVIEGKSGGYFSPQSIQNAKPNDSKSDFQDQSA